MKFEYAYRRNDLYFGFGGEDACNYNIKKVQNKFSILYEMFPIMCIGPGSNGGGERCVVCRNMIGVSGTIYRYLSRELFERKSTNEV